MVNQPMDANAVKAFICDYNPYINKEGKECCNWLITTNEEVARATDQSYHLASIDDLHDWVCASGEVLKGIITTADGNCKWFSADLPNGFGGTECFCEYQLFDVNDKFTYIQSSLSAKLKITFPDTAFNIVKVDEVGISYLFLSWENKAIMKQVEIIINCLMFHEEDVYVHPEMTITPEHMALIKAKADAMGFLTTRVCVGKSEYGEMFRDQYSLQDLETANEILYAERFCHSIA